MIHNSQIAIRLTGVTKKYIVHHDKPTLAERLLNGKGEEFWALKNLNLTIKKGERVGIIGANGSGKTTLLKLITGIASPTKGKIETFGKIVSLIDLEAGFHPDLTGIQNIYLNGTILGMSKDEIDEKIEKIIDFADIDKFIDTPMYTYSSGMSLRLGFSIALYSDPDTLVLDEGMAVGDENFRQKSSEKIFEMRRQNKTFIIVSHSMNIIENLCQRVIWFEKGVVVKDTKANKVIPLYVKSFH